MLAWSSTDSGQWHPGDVLCVRWAPLLVCIYARGIYCLHYQSNLTVFLLGLVSTVWLRRTVMVHRRTQVMDRPSLSSWLSARTEKGLLCLLHHKKLSTSLNKKCTERIVLACFKINSANGTVQAFWCYMLWIGCLKACYSLRLHLADMFTFAVL